jgi:sirohydrochlorin cobaltochelatase
MKNEDEIVVLAAHGAPATDYPAARVGLLMALEFAGGPLARAGWVQAWKHKLDAQVRDWPRTGSNDPYKCAVDDLVESLAVQTGRRVLAAYNEFCRPTIDEAIDQAAAAGAGRVVVIPTMLLRGNEHTETEISAAVQAGRQRHPGLEIRYAWPFRQESLVNLFAEHVMSEEMG